MIQANELRIGNLVKYNQLRTETQVAKVIALIHDAPHAMVVYKHPSFYAPKEIEENEVPAKYVYIEGIPLTPQLLEKCGFVLDKGVGVWFDKKEHDGFRITLWDSHEGRYLFTRQMPSNHIPVFHLHQLQNLYFSLTNQELTIHL
jgi:hypothetical protein